VRRIVLGVIQDAASAVLAAAAIGMAFGGGMWQALGCVLLYAVVVFFPTEEEWRAYDKGRKKNDGDDGDGRS
jgi:hypothetical protein